MQKEAKIRRDAKIEARQRYKIMCTLRQPLIQYARAKKMQEVSDKIEQQRQLKAWCILISSTKVFQSLRKGIDVKEKENFKNRAKLMIQ